MRSIIVPTFFILLLIFSSTTNAEIVFQSSRDGKVGIYVMNDDGTNVRLLTNQLKPSNPSWSPDGKTIVFEKQKDILDSKSQQLFIMHSDGTNIKQLTKAHDGTDKHPSFSPDGKSILFTRFQISGNSKPVLSRKPWDVGSHSLCVMNIEGGNVISIANLATKNPDWSPDCNQIVFSNLPVMGKSGSNIWIIDADGKNPHELLPLPTNSEYSINRFNPKWSSDGKQILFYQVENKKSKIKGVAQFVPDAFRYVIYDIDNKQVTQLQIPENWKPIGIDWMDNGKSVIFSAEKIKLGKPLGRTKHRYNIYKYHIETGKIIRLTKHSGQDFALNWISDDVGGDVFVEVVNALK